MASPDVHMLGRIRLHDYRCFRREAPATLEFQSGFTSFIGPNNSGKSTLIRAVFEIRSALSQIMNLASNAATVLHNATGWNVQPPLYEHAEIVCERDDPMCAVELEPWIPEEERPNAIARARLEFSSDGTSFRCRVFDSAGTELGVPNSPTALNGSSSNDIVVAGRSYDFRALLKFAKNLAEVQYFGPFRNAINEGAGGHFDIQVGTGFINQWHVWKTGPSKVQNRAIERVTEDVRRLIGANTLEITASNELKTLQVVVDKRPHRLQELGAGFSQLVLVLGNALVRRPPWIIIDEPELHLHPALQAEFLTTLACYADFGVLFATHSMGLARLADRCFSVQRAKVGSIVRPFERTPNYAEFLGSLGIAGLQELGWDRILLVEGPKDVRTIQQFLRLYKKDQLTIVLPLGGESMINGTIAHELSEVRRLGGRVGAIIDSERTSESDELSKARKQFAAICEDLGIACCVTQRRAIENYMTQTAIGQCFGSHIKALGPFDTPGEQGIFWGKGESWRAARLMSREDLQSTDIGKFLAEM